MILSLYVMASVAFAFPQSTADHLSPDEIKAAASAKPNSGFAYISDMGFTTPTRCEAQIPGVFIYTPEGWLNALSVNARKQYLPFEPKPEDTLRALTIIAQGCASGTPAGPACESISRVALLSDKGGKVVVEALASEPVSQAWQNGFGARAACTNLVSRFAMSDVDRVRSDKGEFLVATFGGSQLLKTYTVKQKYIRQLGLEGH